MSYSLRNIKSWAEEDRPREKLQSKGRKYLSDAELLAILIGSGTRGQSAVSLAQNILSTANNNLDELGKQSLKALMKFKGIGEAKAITIAAALELGRRRQSTAPIEKPTVRQSKDAFNYISADLSDLPHEEFWIILLNRANRIILKYCISEGGVSGTVADPKLIFSKALEHLASNLILAHNHPSGNLKPSQADLTLTKKLTTAGQALDINILDHLIIGHKTYFSLADEGLM